MNEVIIKIVSYFGFILTKMRTCWLIVTNFLDMKICQNGLVGARVFWEDRRNKIGLY